jgi:ABC-type phosphate transport system auxiliary subunit
MEDKLKKWADQNREAFDDLEPSDAVWSQIEQKLDAEKSKQERSRPVLWVWKAAAVLFLGLSLTLLIDKFRPNEVNLASSESLPVDLPPEFKQVEQFYSARLEEGKKELADLSKGDPHLFVEMTSELLKMDSLYLQLRTKLPHSSNPEAVMDAMTTNLKLRMELLQRQLQLLEQFKDRRSESNTSSNGESSPI